MSSRLLAFTSFFLHDFSLIVATTIIFIVVDVPLSGGVVLGIEVFVAEQGVPDSKKDDVATIVSTASTIPVSAASITDFEITLA
ncbi:hypothetical protein Tco_1340125 [Tanacetum coccineum]